MQTYQFKHCYVMHKHINTNTDIMNVKCQKHSYTGNTYNKLHKTILYSNITLCKIHNYIT